MSARNPIAPPRIPLHRDERIQQSSRWEWLALVVIAALWLLAARFPMGSW